MGKHEAITKLEDTRIYKVIFTTFGILLCLTILSTLALVNTHVSAETTTLSDSKSATASVNVNAACTLSASGTDSHTTTLSGGQYDGNVGTTTVKSICNDSGGYALYAIGYSNNEYGNNKLINSNDSSIYINTGTATSGETSAWSMKLANVTTTDLHTPTIDSPFNNYANVPTTYTKVAHYPNSTMDPSDPSTHDDGSYLTTTYGIYVSPTQAPGTYTGAVKYTLVHPSTEQANLNLYDTVARMSKGKQNAEDLRKEIVTPTQETPVSTNSGVYEYNADEFGVASDANNNYPIYYYRGVLDTYEGLGTYGSDGMSDAYPNYVKLGNNTCWRIVRTTGSGGIKMIYNGLYGATTSGSCGNRGSRAELAPVSYYNRGDADIEGDNNYGVNGFIVYAGYSYNDTYAYNHTEHVSPVDNSTLFSNEVPSNVRAKVEAWYANDMTNYTNALENNAGWCDDRTTYIGSSSTHATIPYDVSGVEVKFGAAIRNWTTNHTLSLGCSNIGGNDILVAPNDISYPIALLTADEASLIGSGRGSEFSSTYNTYSFLTSGRYFWLSSPYARGANSYPSVFIMSSYARLTNTGAYQNNSVRPTVSLVHSTAIVSGSGTAEDPWLIDEN